MAGDSFHENTPRHEDVKTKTREPAISSRRRRMLQNMPVLIDKDELSAGEGAKTPRDTEGVSGSRAC